MQLSNVPSLDPFIPDEEQLFESFKHFIDFMVEQRTAELQAENMELKHKLFAIESIVKKGKI